MSEQIQSILVLGGGSAGLIAAISLKRKIPHVNVTLLRSSDIGIIGVGEGTTPNFPAHMFDYLGIKRKTFFAIAKPTWKLGIRFLWGKRGRFDYTFDRQMDHQFADLSMPSGYYCDEDFSCASYPAALMRHDKVFPRQENGCPDVKGWHAFHIENENLVDLLERVAREIGVDFVEGKLQGAEAAADGKLRSILLEGDRKLTADFFVDASGFRSELLGGFYQEEFVSFRNSLFCDRAVAGGWKRTNEPILPYTTAETMNAGWAWQIEHEHHINRGYVYSSESISDEQAVEEFCRKNPLAPREPRLIKFRSGYYRRQWRENVVAIGNAGGFVEPLEATALMIVCGNVQMLVEMLQRSHLQPSPTMRSLFNRMAEKTWLDIRDFLALHYKFNTLVDTEFWRRCREQTDVSGIQDLIDYYRENGPTGFCRYLLSGTQNDFGLEGYLVMLVGMGVPYEHQSKLSEAERLRWQQYQQTFSSQAMQAMDVKEALGYVHHPQWQWNGD